MFIYPPASRNIVEGNDFYRIKGQAINTGATTVPSIGPGDLIPVDVGFSAIVVGPESDYDRYELIYRDPTARGGSQRRPFSKDRPVIGRITANNAQSYADSDDEKGKAFIRVLDANIDGRRLDLFPAVIADFITDIIVYTGSSPSVIATKRLPKKRSGYLPLAATTQSYFISGYGREVFNMEAVMNSSNNASITVFGGNASYPLEAELFNPSVLGKVASQTVLTEIMASTPVPSGPGAAPLSFCHRAVDNCYFDFYKVEINSADVSLPSDSINGRGFYLSLEVKD